MLLQRMSSRRQERVEFSDIEETDKKLIFESLDMLFEVPFPVIETLSLFYYQENSFIIELNENCDIKAQFLGLLCKVFFHNLFDWFNIYSFCYRFFFLKKIYH